MTTKNTSGVLAWAIGIIAVIILFVYLDSQQRDRWQGFFFPAGCEDRSTECLSQRITSPIFRGEKACYKWGAALMHSHSHPKDVFQCEKNCTFLLGENKCASITRSFRTPSPSAQ